VPRPLDRFIAGRFRGRLGEAEPPGAVGGGRRGGQDRRGPGTDEGANSNELFQFFELERNLRFIVCPGPPAAVALKEPVVLEDQARRQIGVARPEKKIRKSGRDSLERDPTTPRARIARSSLE